MSLTRRLSAWLGFRSAEPDANAVPAGILPPARDGAGALTVDRALTLSAVYRAVAIWATGTSQLTLDVYRGLQKIDPQPAIVRRPDLTTNRSAFIEQTTTSLACTGNAYWRLRRKGNVPSGEVATAEVLNPHLITVIANADGTRIASYMYQGRTLALWEVQHLQLLRIPGHLVGLGPIQAARMELNGALDVSEYASGWFQRGDVPPGILTTEQMLNPDTAAATKKAWYDDTTGIKVLGSGLKFAPIMLSPKDAQWIESQNMSVLQVSRMFGIPSRIMLASLEGGSDTYANLQQEDLSFVRWTLTKALREIEEAFTSLLPSTQTARFNLDGILRGDTQTRYTAHKLAIESGFLTVDEVRAIEGLPALGTAETITGDDTNA